MADLKEKVPDPVGGHMEPLEDEEKLASTQDLDSSESLDDVEQLKKTEELEVSDTSVSSVARERWLTVVPSSCALGSSR